MMRKLVPHRDRRRIDTDDSGAALVGVIGLMLVCTILLMSVATATVFTTNSTAATRATVQARANAEAALDWFVAELAGGATPSALVGSGPDSNSTILSPLDGDLNSAAGLRVTAEGKGRAPGASTPANPVTAKMTVIVTLLAGSPGGSFDTAIFGDAGVSFQNQVKVGNSVDGKNGDIYSNDGEFVCSVAGADVSGKILSFQGNATLNNPCHVGGVHVGGNVTLKDSPTINGDLTVKGNLNQSNGSGPTINGAIRVNGDIVMTAKVVTGDIYSVSGKIELSKFQKLVGNVYGRKNIKFLEMKDVVGSILTVGDEGTNGRVEIQQSTDIIGNVSSPLGATLSNNGNRIQGSVLAWAGSIVGVGNLNDQRITISTQAAVCVSDRISVPSSNPLQSSSCATTSLYSATVYETFYANTGIAKPTLPAELPAVIEGPEVKQLPIIESVDQSGSLLGDWTAAQWTVRSITNVNQLRDLEDPSSELYQVWAASSSGLALYIPRSVNSNQVDFDVLGDDFTLINNLAIVADGGIKSQNFKNAMSDVAGEEREMIWIVPSDSPAVTPSCRTSSGDSAGDLKIHLMSSPGVNWTFYTPCGFKAHNNLGSSAQPVTAVVYAGKVQFSSTGNIKFHSASSIPGLYEATCALSNSQWPNCTGALLGGGSPVGGGAAPGSTLPVILAKFDS